LRADETKNKGIKKIPFDFLSHKVFIIRKLND